MWVNLCSEFAFLLTRGVRGIVIIEFGILYFKRNRAKLFFFPVSEAKQKGTHKLNEFCCKDLKIREVF